MKEIDHQSCQINCKKITRDQIVIFIDLNASLTDIKTRVSVQLSELSRRRRGNACTAVDDKRRPLFVPEGTSIDFVKNIGTRLKSFRRIKRRRKENYLLYTDEKLRKGVTSLLGPDAIDHRPVSLNCTAEQPRPSQDCKLKSNSHDPIRGLENRRSRPFALADPLVARSKAAARYCCSPWISYWCPPCSLLSCNR